MYRDVEDTIFIDWLKGHKLSLIIYFK